MRENEQNIGDQRMLELMCYELDPNVSIVRIHLDDVVKNGELDQDKRLFMQAMLFYYFVALTGFNLIFLIEIMKSLD